MKVNGVLLFILICFFQANAQTDESLPLDERGKLIYYEVVTVKNIKPQTLKVRVLNFVNKKNNDLKLKSLQGDTTFLAKGKLVISKTLLVMSHPSGEVQYEFQIDIKEGKYRFWLTNFSFLPYQRDRYGNFIPSTTVGIPLENDPGKLNAGQWKEYKSQTAKYAKDFAGKFKLAMTSDQPVKVVKEEKKVVVKKEWR